jgi:hypothetical protein
MMALNVEMIASVKVKDKDLRQTDNFTFLSSIITSESGIKKDIHSRLGKASEMNNNI